MSDELYLLRAALVDDKYGEHWISSVTAVDGALHFTLGTDNKHGIQFPKALADAIAEVGSNEQYLLRPVKLAAVELARLMASN
jgi:hypothetical protein